MPFARGPRLIYTWRGQYETDGPTEYVGSDDVITIPAGFRTDLATIPRVFWAILPPNGVYEQAAVVHDFGCVQLAEGTCLLSSRDVDGLFRRVMREGGVSFLTRWLLWCGVRLGALANRYRRPGILRDLPLVLLISLLTLAVAGLVVWGLDTAVHFLTRIF